MILCTFELLYIWILCTWTFGQLNFSVQELSSQKVQLSKSSVVQEFSCPVVLVKSPNVQLSKVRTVHCTSVYKCLSNYKATHDLLQLKWRLEGCHKLSFCLSSMSIHINNLQSIFVELQERKSERLYFVHFMPFMRIRFIPACRKEFLGIKSYSLSSLMTWDKHFKLEWYWQAYF